MTDRGLFVHVETLRRLLADLPGAATIDIDGLPGNPDVSSRGLMLDIGHGPQRVEDIAEADLARVTRVVICDVTNVIPPQ